MCHQPPCLNLLDPVFYEELMRLHKFFKTQLSSTAIPSHPWGVVSNEYNVLCWYSSSLYVSSGTIVYIQFDCFTVSRTDMSENFKVETQYSFTFYLNYK